jgi:hypothetical protein
VCVRTSLAECVLPHIEEVATGRDEGKVVLLRIVEHLPARTPPAVDFEVVIKACMKAADDYLARIQAEPDKEGLAVGEKSL